MSLLIVHRDCDMGEELREWALSYGLNIPIRLHRTMKSAQADLAGNGPPIALVTEIDLPDGEEKQAGLSLALEMRRKWTAGKPIPFILVAPMFDAALCNATLKMPDCNVIYAGSTLIEQYHCALRCLLGGMDARDLPSNGSAPRYHIHIHVSANGDCSYEVRSFGTAVRLARQVRFGVDPNRLQAVLDSIPKELAANNLAATFPTIGDELMRALFREQADVCMELGMLKGLIHAAPATKLGLCFSVDRTFYRIPFEALRAFDSKEKFRYWMEETPLWRSLPEYAYGRPPLFSRADGKTEPVNCLLINASCGGRVTLPDPSQAPGAKASWEMSSLPHAQKEIEDISTELLKAMPYGVGRIGSIEMENGMVRTTIRGTDGKLRPKSHHESFDQVLENLLTNEGPWHLVHFAGHSHFVGPEGKEVGYVFVPQRGAHPHDMPMPKAVGIAKMATWLRDARFVLLSGCSSSHREFVYHLCARNVPAMSGFPWPVVDDIAWKHSAYFYRRLLQSRSIESALQESWADMYSDHNDAWAWASSQFVIQETV